MQCVHLVCSTLRPGIPFTHAQNLTVFLIHYVRRIHPGASGHQVLAELLSGLLSRAVGEVAAGVAHAARRDARVAGLPPPMSTNYYDYRPSFCAIMVGPAESAAVFLARGMQGRQAGSLAVCLRAFRKREHWQLDPLFLHPVSGFSTQYVAGGFQAPGQEGPRL